MFDKIPSKRGVTTTIDVYEVEHATDDTAVVDYLKQANESFTVLRFHFGGAYLFAHIKDINDLREMKKIADFIRQTNGNIFLYESTMLGYLSKASGITFKLTISDGLDYERKEFGMETFVPNNMGDEAVTICEELNNVKPEFDMRTSLAVRLYRPESVEYDFSDKAEIMFKRVSGEVVKD